MLAAFGIFTQLFILNVLTLNHLESLERMDLYGFVPSFPSFSIYGVCVFALRNQPLVCLSVTVAAICHPHRPMRPCLKLPCHDGQA